MLEVFLKHQYLSLSRSRVQRTGTAFSSLFTFHVCFLINVPHFSLAQLNNRLSHLARKSDLESPFSAALVLRALALEYAYFLFRLE